MSFDQDSMSGPSLKDLVVDALQANGVLGKIQAELKASVYLTLEEEVQQRTIPLVDKKNTEILASPIGKLSLAIIRDFITCLGLEFTSSVLESEANITSFNDIPQRDTLIEEFNLHNINDNEQNTPVLFRLINDLQISSEKHSIRNEYSDKRNTDSEISTNEELLINLNISNKSCDDKISTNNSTIDKKVTEEKNFHDKDNGTSQRDTDESHSNASLVSGSRNAYDEEFASNTESEQKDSENVDITENMDEIIEEDISINDVINSLSEMTESTKDFTASEKTDLCDYKENL